MYVVLNLPLYLYLLRIRVSPNLCSLPSLRHSRVLLLSSRRTSPKLALGNPLEYRQNEANSTPQLCALNNTGSQSERGHPRTRVSDAHSRGTCVPDMPSPPGSRNEVPGLTNTEGTPPGTPGCAFMGHAPAVASPHPGRRMA